MVPFVATLPIALATKRIAQLAETPLVALYAPLSEALVTPLLAPLPSPLLALLIASLLALLLASLLAPLLAQLTARLLAPLIVKLIAQLIASLFAPLFAQLTAPPPLSAPLFASPITQLGCVTARTTDFTTDRTAACTADSNVEDASTQRG